MNIKKIMILSVLAVMLLGCISTASAGWFDNKVESDTYKFDCPKDYHQESDAEDLNGTKYVYLTDDNGDYKILVSEVTEENYTNFSQKEFKNESGEYNLDSDSFSLKTGHTILKDIKEDNMRIVTFSYPGVYATRSLIQKDGYYYQIDIQHEPNDDVLGKDIQIIKDIHNSLERK